MPNTQKVIEILKKIRDMNGPHIGFSGDDIPICEWLERQGCITPWPARGWGDDYFATGITALGLAYLRELNCENSAPQQIIAGGDVTITKDSQNVKVKSTSSYKIGIRLLDAIFKWKK